MKILLLFFFRACVAALLGVGLFQVLQEWLRYPTYRATHMMRELSGKKTDWREKYVYPVSFRVAKYVKLEEYKRRRMESELDAVHSAFTPEIHTANALVAGGYCLILAFLTLPVIPLLFPFVLFLAGVMYLKEMNAPGDLLKKRRERIEKEIPQMVGTVSSGLKHKQTVAQYVRKYRDVASPAFQAELDVLLTDIQYSSEETGLIQFESRMNSTQVSALVRGLLGIARGDDMSSYFSLIDHDMKDSELSKLRREAMMRPKQLTAANFSLVICVIVMYMAVMGMQIFDSFNVMM